MTTQLNITREQFDAIATAGAGNPGYKRLSAVVFQQDVTAAGKTKTQTWVWNTVTKTADVYESN